MSDESLRQTQSAPDVGTQYHTSYTSTGDVYAIDSDIDVLKIEYDKEQTGVSELEYTAEETEEQQGLSEVLERDDGILDEETISVGLCNLQLSADGESIASVQLSLPGYHLIDIETLAEHTELQKIDLPWNDLTDLSGLRNMRHLLILDVSHNRLTKLLDMAPPRNLKIVDFSYNMILEIENLCHHPYMEKLYLSNNVITEMKGFSHCTRLTTLDLGHNKISEIKGLGTLPLRHLYLNNNRLTSIDSLEGLQFLQTVVLCGNKIRSLRGLENHYYLSIVDLEDNEVIDMRELTYIKECKLLRNLNLLRNPIQELPDYWLSVLHHVPQLSVLDMCKIDIMEKVAGLNTYNPPMEVVASCDHVMNTVFRFLQPTQVWESTLASLDTPYPMLVIVGPCGSGKKQLCMKLVKDFPQYFGYTASHTTRKPLPEETDGKQYHFINRDQFEYDVKTGQFIQTCELDRHLYGLQMNSIEKVAKRGLASVLHMELEGMLALKKTYLEPRYVLILPVNKHVHEQSLRQNSKHDELSIIYQLKRADMYAKYHADHPGFFDIIINSESMQKSYDKLRNLVMDYLGILHDTEKPTEEVETPSVPSSAVKRHIRALSARAAVGVVEVESLKRREYYAKRALSGGSTKLYDRLIGTENHSLSHFSRQHIRDSLSADSSSNRSNSANTPAPELGHEDPTYDQITTHELHGSSDFFGKFVLSAEFGENLSANSPPTYVINRPGSSKHTVLPPIGASS